MDKFRDYQIIADTGCDIPDEMVEEYKVKLIPFLISQDEETFIDDGSNSMKILEAMEASPNPVRTACASPGAFIEALEGTTANEIYIVTISGKLSGSYASAMNGVKQFMEAYPEKKVHVFDSMSASAGESLVVIELHRQLQVTQSHEELVAAMTKFVEKMKTYFIIDTLDSLMKNGRLSKAKGLIATALNVKPILGSDGQGEIMVHGIHRGIKRSAKSLVNIIAEELKNSKNRTLVISHADAKQLAMDVANKLRERINIKEILIFSTRGLSSAYSQRGGIVVAY